MHDAVLDCPAGIDDEQFLSGEGNIPLLEIRKDVVDRDPPAGEVAGLNSGCSACREPGYNNQHGHEPYPNRARFAYVAHGTERDFPVRRAAQLRSGSE